MPEHHSQTPEQIAQQFDLQNQQWAALEADLRELATRGIAISRDVLAEIDAAFAPPSSAQPMFLTALLG